MEMSDNIAPEACPDDAAISVVIQSAKFSCDNLGVDAAT